VGWARSSDGDMTTFWFDMRQNLLGAVKTVGLLVLSTASDVPDLDVVGGITRWRRDFGRGIFTGNFRSKILIFKYRGDWGQLPKLSTLHGQSSPKVHNITLTQSLLLPFYQAYHGRPKLPFTARRSFYC